MSWKLSRLSIKGVKGILERSGEFDFGDGRSIAIYAPNGCGKSGYADALEYLFSKDGAVEHLGKGGADSEQGGKHAIPHVLADSQGITPQVSVTIHDKASRKTIQATRPVKIGRNDQLPTELQPLLDSAPAHRILRQHDLRHFIVDLEPSEKYTELSRWLGLERLEEVLRHLTTTQRTLARTSPDRQIEERLKDVANHTNGMITIYERDITLMWCALEAKKHLGQLVPITTVAGIEDAISLLRNRRDEIVIAAGKADALYNARGTIERSVTAVLSEEGQVRRCSLALDTAVEAEREVEQAEKNAQAGVFQEAWSATNRALQARTVVKCPICQTEWDRTATGSQAATIVHLTDCLGSLSELVGARARQREAVTQLHATTRELGESLTSLQPAATTLSLSSVATAATELSTELLRLILDSGTARQLAPAWQQVLDRVKDFARSEVAPALAGVEIAGMPASAREIDDSIGHLQAIRDALTRLAALQHESEEYRKVDVAFSLVANAIQQRTASLVDTVVGALRNDVNVIYRTIHPTGAVPEVHIVPDTSAKTLSVRVSFHSADRRVPPAGYLS